jgi:hypothetical protein
MGRNMSMNFFFKAFRPDQIEAMLNDNKLIDAWILQNKAFMDSMDVETAWHVLQTVLNGDGFDGETVIDEALFNGCLIASPDSVLRQAKGLGCWSSERLLASVAMIDPESDLYHAEIWADEDSQQELLDHFNNLKDFFSRAADHGWGIVLYAA